MDFPLKLQLKKEFLLDSKWKKISFNSSRLLAMF